MAKDEIDAVEECILHNTADGACALVAADNGSTDGTREVLERYAAVLVDWRGFDQGACVSHLAELARTQLDPDWIVHTDADEKWVGLSTLAEVPAGVLAVRAPVCDHGPSDLSLFGVHTGYFKVAHRPFAGAEVLAGNHALAGVHAPMWPHLTVQHRPLRSFAQMYRKAVRARALASSFPPGWYTEWKQLADDLEAGRLMEVWQCASRTG